MCKPFSQEAFSDLQFTKTTVPPLDRGLWRSSTQVCVYGSIHTRFPIRHMNLLTGTSQIFGPKALYLYFYFGLFLKDSLSGFFLHELPRLKGIYATLPKQPLVTSTPCRWVFLKIKQKICQNCYALNASLRWKRWRKGASLELALCFSIICSWYSLKWFAENCGATNFRLEKLRETRRLNCSKGMSPVLFETNQGIIINCHACPPTKTLWYSWITFGAKHLFCSH